MKRDLCSVSTHHSVYMHRNGASACSTPSPSPMHGSYAAAAPSRRPLLPPLLPLLPLLLLLLLLPE